MFDHEESVLPPGIETMEPGMMLAAILQSVADVELSAADRLAVLRAHERMASHYQARMYRDMADVADLLYESGDDRAAAAEAAGAEVRAALRMTRRHAENEMAFALQLDGELRSVGIALSDGRLDVRRAKVIADGTIGLVPAAREWVVERIMDDALLLTTGQLRARVARLCVDADPDAARLQHEASVADRRVVVEPSGVSTADVIAIGLPADRVAAASRRVNEIARSLRRRGEPRTMDQLRADVFLDLLEGRDIPPTRRRGVVDVRVDLATLAALSNGSGELGGYGPVIADVARQVADRQRDAEWRFTVTHPDSEQPIHTGLIRRRPSASHRRQIEAVDRTCVFPGCRMPATDCDLDHRLRHADGGHADPENLVPLCRHDHRIRHEHGWTHQRLPDGDHQWTSKLGETYTTSGAPP